jgi:hypothetical protein
MTASAAEGNPSRTKEFFRNLFYSRREAVECVRALAPEATMDAESSIQATAGLFLLLPSGKG